MKCYYHPDIDAVTTCAFCGKAICQSDVVDIGGKIYCQNDLAIGNITNAQPVPSKPNNPLAIISLILGVLGIMGCLCIGGIGGILFGIPAAITGYIARKQLSQPENTQEGMQLATIGMVLGISEVFLIAVLLLCILVLTGLGVGTGVLGVLLEQLQMR